MALERPRILMTLMMMTVMMMTFIVKTMMVALTKDHENDTNNGSNDGDGTEDSGFDNDCADDGDEYGVYTPDGDE